MRDDPATGKMIPKSSHRRRQQESVVTQQFDKGYGPGIGVAGVRRASAWVSYMLPVVSGDLALLAMAMLLEG